jgi:hypothetical protein
MNQRKIQGVKGSRIQVKNFKIVSWTLESWNPWTLFKKELAWNERR